LTTFLAGSKACYGHSRDYRHGGTYLHSETGSSNKNPTGADSAVTGAVTGTS